MQPLRIVVPGLRKTLRKLRSYHSCEDEYRGASETDGIQTFGDSLRNVHILSSTGVFQAIRPLQCVSLPLSFLFGFPL